MGWGGGLLVERSGFGISDENGGVRDGKVRRMEMTRRMSMGEMQKKQKEGRKRKERKGRERKKEKERNLKSRGRSVLCLLSYQIQILCFLFSADADDSGKKNW